MGTFFLFHFFGSEVVENAGLFLFLSGLGYFFFLGERCGGFSRQPAPTAVVISFFFRTMFRTGRIAPKRTF